MRFSFSSVVLSYFLVGGGMFSAMLVAGVIKLESPVPVYLLMGAGAFVGGFFAARASRGSSVTEAAVGAIVVVGTIVGLAAFTEVGQFLWHVAQGETMKFVGLVGGSSAVGAIAGAFISEKLLGEATSSAAPWILYSALATFGACLLATVFATVLLAGGSTADESTADGIAKGLLAGIAVGCLVAGVSIGASARVRPLGAAFLGAALGTAGFAYLISLTATGGHSNSDSAAVIGVFAGGGGIVTFLGAALGWAVIGRKASA
jgi:hypothetical protein